MQTQILFPYRKSNENTQAFHHYHRIKRSNVVCYHKIHPTTLILYSFRLCRGCQDNNSYICHLMISVLDHQFSSQKRIKITHITYQISNTGDIMIGYQRYSPISLRTSSKLSQYWNYRIIRDIYRDMSSLCMCHVYALHYQKDIKQK